MFCLLQKLNVLSKTRSSFIYERVRSATKLSLGKIQHAALDIYGKKEKKKGTREPPYEIVHCVQKTCMYMHVRLIARRCPGNVGETGI